MQLVQALRRLPVRARLTLAFAAAMALVLAATGTFVYLRTRSDLDESIDSNLRSRSVDVRALARESDGLGASEPSLLTQHGDSFAQVLTGRGEIFDAAPRLRLRPLLSRPELARALRGTVVVERGGSRLLAVPLRAHGERLAVVVGSSLDDRDEALNRLLLALAIGGPAALLLASLAGYGVAAAALRPVESIRREAAEVSVTEPGRRLPVPPARDELARLAKTLNQMLARQETAFARERAFVADASHELRTPLSILRAELELALREGRSEEELKAALRSAAEETDRLTQLAEDLLVLARSDHGQLRLRREEVSAAELLDRAGR